MSLFVCFVDDWCLRWLIGVWRFIAVVWYSVAVWWLCWLVGCTAIDLRFDYWFTVWVTDVGVLWRVGLGFVVAFGSVVFVCCG